MLVSSATHGSRRDLFYLFTWREHLECYAEFYDEQEELGQHGRGSSVGSTRVYLCYNGQVSRDVVDHLPLLGPLHSTWLPGRNLSAHALLIESKTTGTPPILVHVSTAPRKVLTFSLHRYCQEFITRDAIKPDGVVPIRFQFVKPVHLSRIWSKIDQVKAI